jgi:hypothetical protein
MNVIYLLRFSSVSYVDNKQHGVEIALENSLGSTAGIVFLPAGNMFPGGGFSRKNAG